jgi:shikimate dehydrogenase
MTQSSPLLASVIGYPVKHSRSPVIHNYWMKKHGIEGHYGRSEVAPDKLTMALMALSVSETLKGCNVTLPHKEAALSQLDEVDPLAKKIGAVNTIIVREEGELFGLNTDAYGFTQNLNSAGSAWRKKSPALIVGAGGAARAVVAALVQAGCSEIYVTNRTPDRLRSFCRELGASFEVPLRMVGWEDREEALGQIDLLVNTTSQGMEGEKPLDLDLKKLRNTALVADLVYTPVETPLLREAKRRNHPTVDGLGMLLHQAAPGFEAWFGIKPVVDDELRNAVIEDLQKNKA